MDNGTSKETLRLLITVPGGDHKTLCSQGGRLVRDEGQAAGSIDLSAWYTISGLGDGHLHLAAQTIDDFLAGPNTVEMADVRERGAGLLASGVLSALDKGDKDGSTLAALDEPATRMPHLQMAGAIHSSPGGYYQGVGATIEGADLALRAAQPSRAMWFKVIGDWPRRGKGSLPNFSEEDLAEAVRAAHASRKRVAVHSMAPATASAAVAAGVDSIEHGLFLTSEDIAALGSRNGYWVPTVAAMEDVVAFLGAGSTGGRLVSAGLENVRGLLPLAHDAGVRVLAGTDLSRNVGSIAAEAALLVEYGLAPQHALAAATDRVHEAVGKPYGFAPGDPADVVCVDGDPSDDIDALSRVRFVMRLGHVAFHSG